jgi:hypothetical protein
VDKHCIVAPPSTAPLLESRTVTPSAKLKQNAIGSVARSARGQGHERLMLQPQLSVWAEWDCCFRHNPCT